MNNFIYNVGDIIVWKNFGDHIGRDYTAIILDSRNHRIYNYKFLKHTTPSSIGAVSTCEKWTLERETLLLKAFNPPKYNRIWININEN